MDDDVQIFGVEQVAQALQEMGPKMMKKAIHDALDYSGNVLQVAQIEAAPSGDGNSEHPAGQLKQDIRRKVQLQPEEGVGIVVVGPSKHSYYGMFSEFGTSHEPARPWMRPAFEAAAPEAIEMFEKVLAAYIAESTKEKK